LDSGPRRLVVVIGILVVVIAEKEFAAKDRRDLAAAKTFDFKTR
jgi:hypothetical protein